MPNLKTLDILLFWEHANWLTQQRDPPSRQPQWYLPELTFLAPMKTVRVEGRFEVRVNWPGEFYSAPFPFKVIRDLTRFDIPLGGSRFVRAN